MPKQGGLGGRLRRAVAASFFSAFLLLASEGARLDPAVFVDEFDAGVLESTPNDIEGGAGRLDRSRLKKAPETLVSTNRLLAGLQFAGLTTGI